MNRNFVDYELTAPAVGRDGTQVDALGPFPYEVVDGLVPFPSFAKDGAPTKRARPGSVANLMVFRMARILTHIRAKAITVGLSVVWSQGWDLFGLESPDAEHDPGLVVRRGL